MTAESHTHSKSSWSEKCPDFETGKNNLQCWLSRSLHFIMHRRDAGIVEQNDLNKAKAETPLPRGPTIALSIMFLTNSLAQTVLFPFAPLMVQHFNVASKSTDIGYYAGYLASCAYLGSLASSFFWGKVSDKVGRRPILLQAMLVNVVCGITFGFSTSFYMAMAARLTNGFFCILAVGKTALAEISDETNQAQGFAIIGLTWGIGLLLGPAIGGFLCLPAEKYPWIFPRDSLFARFPFALPCTVIAVFTCAGFVASIFLLPETMKSSSVASYTLVDNDDEELSNFQEKFPEGSQSPESVLSPTCHVDVEEQEVAKPTEKPSKTSPGSPGEKKMGQENSEEEELLKHDTSVDVEDLASSLFGAERVKATKLSAAFDFKKCRSESPGQLTTFSVAMERDTVVTIAIYCILGLAYVAYDEFFTLWCLTDWSVGGLGFDSNSLGFAQTGGGLSLIPFQLFIYPRIVAQRGTLNTLRLGLLIGMGLACIPGIRFLEQGSFQLVVAALMVQMSRGVAAMCAFTSIFILISNSVRYARFMGSINGISQTLYSMCRAIAPTAGGSLFAWSIGRWHPFPLDHHLCFLVFACVLAATYKLSLVLKPTINHRKT